MKGKVRCRMHGGACGSGAQIDNANALKHGRYTTGAIARRRNLAALLKSCRDHLRSIPS